eukprot:EG_transcript_6473
MAKVLNFNVGILGHVDSGKTSLAKALSTERSTACFDKHPQSQERGITLDLGFSSFDADVPPHLASLGYDRLQYTLVDCPGHASLIRTVIGGAQIIDLMVLVIDIVKGVQTQTAECIVLGEILAKDLVIVLNKVDLVVATESQTMEQQIERTVRKMKATFAKTRWPDAPMVLIAANPAAGPPVGLPELVSRLQERTHPPNASGAAAYDQFLLYVDHCFAIRGQGTVLTGTVLQGAIAVGQSLHLPEFKVDKKVKSIQVFHKPVPACTKGDRVGICVTQFDAANLERGIACASSTSGVVCTYTTAIARVWRVRFFKQALKSNAKLHITVGHSTVMATVRFFMLETHDGVASSPTSFDVKARYRWLPELPLEDSEAPLFAILFFEKLLVTATDATLIAAKLDADIHATQCRLVLHGCIVHAVEGEQWKEILVIKDKCKEAQVDRVVDDYTAVAKNLVIKDKCKEAQVDRVVDDYTAVAKNLVSKDGDVSRFVGMRIHYQPQAMLENDTSTGPSPVHVGLIEGTFGKTGKFKVRFDRPVFPKGQRPEGYTLALHYQVNQFDKSKKMLQPAHLGPPATVT